MFHPRVHRRIAHGTLVALSLIVVGCSDDVHVDSVLRPPENRPPTIVTTGPDAPSGPVEVLPYGRTPAPYVLVADPDGLDDISVVFITVDSAVVRRVIARSDTMLPNQFCRQVNYAAMDTFPIDAYIPSFYPGPSECLMRRTQGGYYTSDCFNVSNPYAECLAFPSIQTASPYFLQGQISGICYIDGGILSFQIAPPAVPSNRNLYVTAIDVEYSGISVTVYDGAGASVSAKLPGLRIIYTTAPEKTAAP
jgi:hypothetical protein